jgi:F0F1-type ATP synthase assembly protein I
MATDPKQNWSGGVETGWSVVSTLIAGIATIGFLGYLADQALGTEKIFTGVGFLLGGIAGIYIVIIRYGRGDGGRD